MERPAREEKLNAATHGLGTILAFFAAIALIAAASSSRDWMLVLACGIYGFSLVGVFGSSAMSHWAKTDQSRRRYRALDQAFIYLMIVATYTPFSVAHLRSPFWWCLLGAMWAVAIVGMVRKLWSAHRVDSVFVPGYILLGWMPALGGTAIFQGVPTAAVIGIFGGGILYTIGTVFLLLDGKVWYFHAIWHVLVIAGAAVHWWTTMVYVV